MSRGFSYPPYILSQLSCTVNAKRICALLTAGATVSAEYHALLNKVTHNTKRFSRREPSDRAIFLCHRWPPYSSVSPGWFSSAPCVHKDVHFTDSGSVLGMALKLPAAFIRFSFSYNVAQHKVFIWAFSSVVAIDSVLHRVTDETALQKLSDDFEFVLRRIKSAWRGSVVCLGDSCLCTVLCECIFGKEMCEGSLANRSDCQKSQPIL